MPGVLKPVVSPVVLGRSASSAVSSTFSGSGSGNTLSDFATRRTSPGVFRYFTFDDASQLGMDATTTTLGTTPSTCFGWGAGSGPNATNPTIDLTKGALKLQVNSGSTNDGAGKWITRFSDDTALRIFRTNCSLYIQWSFEHDGYYSPGALGMQNGTAPKFAYLGDGSTTAAQQIVYALKNDAGFSAVIQAYSHLPIVDIYVLAAYNSSTGTWDVAFNCPYFGGGTPGPACMTIPANKKVWFQLGVQFGNPVTGFTTAGGMTEGGTAYSAVETYAQLWMTVDGVTSQIIDYGPTTPEYKPLDLNPNTSIGVGANSFAFSAYQTSKDPSVVHPTYHQWYDELIFSTQRIPDPAPGTTTPTWRQGLTVGQWYPIANTANLSNIWVGTPVNRFNPEYTVDVWQGLCADNRSMYGTSSGHGSPHNGTYKIDLSANAPQFVALDIGSNPGLPAWSYTDPTAYANRGRYFLDGRPATRHVYNSLEVTGGMLYMFGAYATYANDGFIGPFFDTSCYFGLPDTEGFDLTTKQWVQGLPGIPFSRTINPGQAPMGQAFSTTKDPRNGDIYLSLQYRWIRYRNGGYTILRSLYADDGQTQVDPTVIRVDLADCCATIDTARNRFVAFTRGYPLLAVDAPRLDILNLADNTQSVINITGDFLTMDFAIEARRVDGSAFIYDPDNDRYIIICRGAPQQSPGNFHVYSVNPNNGVSTFLGNGPFNTGVGGGNGAAGVYKRAQYIPDLGGIAFLPSYSSNIHFMPTRTQ